MTEALKTESCADFTARLASRDAVPGVTVYRGAGQSGVFSVTVDHMDCEEVGATLAGRGVAVRAGLHCAPLAHRTAGTEEGGTVRFSVSAFNTARQMDRAAEIFRQIVSQGKGAR